MKRLAFVLLACLLAAAGCQDRAFVNLGRGRNGHQTGVPNESVDEFARKQGISRQEALQYLRQGQAEAAKAGRQTAENLPPSDPVEGPDELPHVEPTDAGPTAADDPWFPQHDE